MNICFISILLKKWQFLFINVSNCEYLRYIQYGCFSLIDNYKQYRIHQILRKRNPYKFIRGSQDIIMNVVEVY